ncbi:MAG: sulfurtransferase TusA family protein [Sulfobacillus sp.]
MRPEQVDQTLDARGLLCPMPVIKANKTMQAMAPASVLEVLASDKGSLTDIPAWCASQKHTLLYSDVQDGVYRYYVQRGA